MKKLEKLDNKFKPTGVFGDYPDEQAERMLAAKKPFWREVSEKSDTSKSKSTAKQKEE